MGRRFETTTGEALEQVAAARLNQIDDPEARERERKVGTTRTSSSVVFGFDAVDYETDAQARQKDILSAARADRVDGKAMKKALTATHFVLGNDALDYATVNKMEDPTGRMSEFRSASLKANAGKSSAYFGSDEPCYRTTMADALEFDQVALAAHNKNGSMRAQAVKLKAALSGHNFVLGDDSLSYKTTAHEAYTFDAKTARGARGALNPDLTADLRREHFHLGDERVDYTTNARRSMQKPLTSHARVCEMKEDSRRAGELKDRLLRTSVVIGDDPVYMN